MIITFGHTKGGTGKSTLAIHLAIALASSRNVLLIDGDEQRSSLNFTELRVANGKQDYTCVALYGTSLLTQGQSLSKLYDEVIIDVGGRDSGSLRAALTLTSLLIVPVQPRTFDVWAMDTMNRLVCEAKVINPSLKAHSLINLGEVQGHENEEAKEALTEFSAIEYLDCPIMRRKVYAESLAQGKGVTEMKNTKAKDEIESLLSNVYPRSIT